MKKTRISTVREMKSEGRKAVMVTAYDAITASYAAAAGVDIVLVGDSLGMTVLGFETTLNVTLEMMLHHGAAVARGARGPLLVGDMPFMTYKVSAEQALASCARMIQEGAMEAVKLEGGAEIAPTVRRVVDAGIPVMGHVGLTPQSYHAQSGFRVQGRGDEGAARLIEDARALEGAGVFSIVLELMPAETARRVTEAVGVPTLGIGAGPDCDGQVLIIADILGMTAAKPYKMVKRYADLHSPAVEALQRFATDVRSSTFPGPENTIAE